MGLRLDAMKKDDKEPKTAVTVGTAPERPFRGYKIIIGILFLLFVFSCIKTSPIPCFGTMKQTPRWRQDRF